MRTDDKYIFDLVPAQQSPESRAEIMDILLKGIRDIELQLSGERVDATGKRLTPHDYANWRKSALKAMNYRVLLYRKYKALNKPTSNAPEYLKDAKDVEQSIPAATEEPVSTADTAAVDATTIDATVESLGLTPAVNAACDAYASFRAGIVS